MPQITDQLTGLIRRAVFDERLTGIFANAKENETPISFAFVDIDQFKPINDTYGHASGDFVLQAVAASIKQATDDGAIVARYGGDEFALLFPNTEREQAFLTLEKIRSEVEALKQFGEGENAIEAQVTISGGIAAYPIDGRTTTEVLRKADQALYRSKKIGRNRIRLAHEEKMAPKTAHFTLTQLERLSKLAKEQGVGEAVLLREALDDLILKYGITSFEF